MSILPNTLSQFKVNAPAVTLYNLKTQKSEVIKQNEIKDTADYDPRDLLTLAVNSLPLVIARLMKNNEIVEPPSFEKPEEAIALITSQKYGHYKSSIQFLGAVPENKTEKESVKEQRKQDEKEKAKK